MMFSSLILLEILMFVIALSVDLFYSGFVCGSNRIQIPLLSVIGISFISNLILSLSLLFGATFKLWFPESFTTTFSFLLLLGLGMIKTFDQVVATLIQNHFRLKNETHSSPFQLFLQIYANPGKADQDHSNVLSLFEGVCISLSFSLSELTTGLSAGFTPTSSILLIGLSFLCNLFAIILGLLIGNKTASSKYLNLGFISGTLFILLAIMKLP
ncbi:MAG: sporulation rane protein YtaF [Evtepia sp.]|nr:sporulation rane protein YtaF [Evtepia sp.]